uniref:Uncharacterized protein n=1 Tax=Vibrio crassostreae TaxID=246167 RepID=A0A0H4A1V3_9VIBR|nr:hypothetical protein [Vibrio crassostreae]
MEKKAGGRGNKIVDLKSVTEMAIDEMQAFRADGKTTREINQAESG